MKRYSPLFLSIFVFFLAQNNFAQEKEIWIKSDLSSSHSPADPGKTKISNYKLLSLDKSLLKQKLQEISGSENDKLNSRIIKFPNKNGVLSKFEIRKNSLLHPDLAKKFPDIATFSGKSLEKEGTSIFFTLNRLGLFAMILSPEGAVYIDPYSAAKEVYMVYAKKAASTNGLLACLVSELGPQAANIHPQKSSNVNDLKLRTFRLAMATTEEYSTFHVDAAGVGAGSTRADSINAVLSAITVTMTRVNPVFERDVALSMQLIANTDELIFLQTDPGNDPYSNNNGSAMLTQNQTTIDNTIGVANYDIGHVFSTGGGGVAYLNSPCGSSKAGGVTGLSSPVGDIFDIDLVAHEMGHQFGARHTFNGTSGSCAANRSNDTAVEPGSGSTIMGYAGICAPQNIQSGSDAYFSSTSILEMFSNITAGASQCATLTDFTVNLNTPTVNAGGDYTIPRSTPFKLLGQGTDADSNPLTYCWEQIDNEVGDIDNPPSATQTEGAVFRSLLPSSEPNRYMPELPTVIAGNISSTWEVVPAVSRSMDFELTVRDNVIGEGQAVTDQMTVTVNDLAGPFTVSSQNVENIVWTEGGTETITWNVAGTTSNGIDAANVDIFLSLDGGLTFSEQLASSTPNDGEEQVTVPNMAAPNVRVMVAASDNIFYAVNSEPFSIGNFEMSCTDFTPVDVPLAIPDNSATGASSVVQVLDDFLVTDLNLEIDLTHTWLWDLQIYLKAPNGTEVLIFDRSCGSAGLQRQDINAIFDDDAVSSSCEDAVPAVSGITLPDNLLSAFNGVSSFGDWTLKIVDNAQNDIGVLNTWTLELCQSIQTASTRGDGLENFNIFPNPFTHDLHISFRPTNTEDVIISFYDLSGRLVEKNKYENLGFQFKKDLNLDQLASGVYIMQVLNGNARVSKKIVKY